MMNKKLILCGLTMTLALTAGAIAFSTANEEVVQFQHVAANAQTLTLNSSNKPTISADLGSLEYNEFVHFTYTNASQADGDNHVVLSEGGKIRKTEASNGLSSITVNFAGALMVETSFADSFGGVNAVALTSGSEQSISGNYWRLIATADTTITSITLNYGCDTPTQGYNVGNVSLRRDGGSMMLDLDIAYSTYSNEQLYSIQWAFDIERNGSYYSDWNYAKYYQAGYQNGGDPLDFAFSSIDNNVATYSVDVSDLPVDNAGYVVHFGEYLTAMPDIKPKVFENVSMSLNGKQYSLKCYCGADPSADGAEQKYWGDLFIEVSDEKVAPTEARIEIQNNKPMLVIAGNQNYLSNDYFTELSIHKTSDWAATILEKTMTVSGTNWNLSGEIPELEAGQNYLIHFNHGATVNDLEQKTGVLEDFASSSFDYQGKHYSLQIVEQWSRNMIYIVVS